MSAPVCTAQRSTLWRCSTRRGFLRRKLDQPRLRHVKRPRGLHHRCSRSSLSWVSRVQRTLISPSADVEATTLHEALRETSWRLHVLCEVDFATLLFVSARIDNEPVCLVATAPVPCRHQRVTIMREMHAIRHAVALSVASTPAPLLVQRCVQAEPGQGELSSRSAPTTRLTARCAPFQVTFWTKIVDRSLTPRLRGAV